MFFKLTVQQLWHKRVVALLVFLAMTALVTLYVYSSNTSTFANRSMQLVMKNMGHNLLLPQEADLQAVYLCSDEQTTFPEKTTRELAKHVSPFRFAPAGFGDSGNDAGRWVGKPQWPALAAIPTDF